MRAALVLTFHAIRVVGRPLAVAGDPGAARYEVSLKRFEQVLDAIDPRECGTVDGLAGVPRETASYFMN